MNISQKYRGLFDSHAHYFDEWIGEEWSELLDEFFSSGGEGVINVGTNNENSLVCIEQAKKYEKMYCAVGIHPEDCLYLSGSPKEEVARLRALVGSEEERRKNKIVALGEIGFDYHVEGLDEAGKQLQREYFERQMSLAEELCLPVIIHDREAHGDCFEMALKYPRVRGVFHSYSGSAEMAKELTRRGWYISFSGVVTFKNAPKVKEVAATVPADRILSETDAPYLAPVPYRGKRNSSSLMLHTVEAIADERKISPDEAKKIIRENTRTLFGV
ncbi:MAG: TatD family hydrolase [Clostridia bacterium]|nr:TatD family hydrolase [Clostridia bacterium]